MTITMSTSEAMTADIIHRFSFDQAPIRGQWIRLDQVLNALNERQSYPPPVQALLAEMLAAVTMVADGIGYPGSVALQARGAGPLTTLLAECRSQHMLRGIARWPEDTDIGGPITVVIAGNGCIG